VTGESGAAAVADSVRQFNMQIDKWAKTVPKELAVRGHRALALEALRLIRDKSPVKTGRFRGNNQLTVSEPAAGTIPLGLIPPDNVALQQAITTLKALQPFGRAWISNNLPYAVPIEEGHSRQRAPRGVYAITLAELNEAFDFSGVERQVEREAGK